MSNGRESAKRHRSPQAHESQSRGRVSSATESLPVAFGIGYSGEAGGFPILNRRYYGYAPVGSAHGMQMLGAGLGMVLGGWIGGSYST